MGSMCGCLNSKTSDKDAGSNVDLTRKDNDFERDNAAAKIQKGYREYKSTRSAHNAQGLGNDPLFEEYFSRLSLDNPTTKVYIYIYIYI